MERIDRIKVRITKKDKIAFYLLVYNEMFEDLLKVEDERYNNFGLIDKTGKEVVACIFKDMKLSEDDLLAVRKTNSWGFIDKNGKNVIPYMYDDVNNFSEGLAAVCLNGKYGFIDKQNKVVIPFEYDDATSFNEGLAIVKKKKRKSDRWLFIDNTGKELSPCTNDMLEIFKEKILEKRRMNKEKQKEDIEALRTAIDNNVVAEEIYISSEKEIPSDCLSIEIIGYNSVFILDNNKLEIEYPTKEEWATAIINAEKIATSELSILENKIKDTSLVKKRNK